jgi:hypothetical protein
MTTEYLRTVAAAAFLQRHFGFGSPRTLSNGRILGSGPVFRKCGRFVLYDPADLLAWGQSRLSEPRRSTSQVRSQRAKTDLSSKVVSAQ